MTQKPALDMAATILIELVPVHWVHCRCGSWADWMICYGSGEYPVCEECIEALGRKIRCRKQFDSERGVRP